MTEKIYIYRIYFPTNNKCYIGQTNNLKMRLPLHLRSGSLVCKALWKFNNWEVSILHTAKDKDAANLLEIEDIRNFNSVAPNGYNLTAGGDGAGLGNRNSIGNRSHLGKTFSKESKKKMRQAKIGKKLSKEHIKKLGHPGNKYFAGHKHSEESIQKGIEIKRKNGTLKRSKKQKLRMQLAQLKRRIREMEQGGAA